jgi:hypothetical protein
MLPSVSLGISVEMLRDGGSLCAEWQGSDGAYYWLLVPIQNQEHQAATHELSRYDAPVVVDRPLGINPIQITWAHAEILLDQIIGQLPATKPTGWIGPMRECLKRHGVITYSEVLSLHA